MKHEKMKPLIFLWIQKEEVEKYLGEGWAICSRWSSRPFYDSWLMVKEEENGLSTISEK